MSGKRYIGKTMKSVNERWKAHQYDALHRNRGSHFHNAIRKHGVDAFELEWVKHVEVFDVSADFPDEPNIRTSLDLEEVLLIEHWDTFEGDGYNMTMGGEGGNGQQVASWWRTLDEEKRKVHAAKCMPKNGLTLPKSVFCVELDRKFVSARSAAKSLQAKGHRIYQPLISRCANGLQKTHAGFHWKWVT